ARVPQISARRTRMRVTLAGLCWVIAAAALWAAGERKPEARTLEPMLAQKYALALLRTSGLVAQEYVRPVPRAELIRAGLAGLYEAAKLPAPASLAEDVRRADDKDEKLLTLMQTTRARVGDLGPLKDPNDILASLRAMTRVLDPYSTVVTTD